MDLITELKKVYTNTLANEFRVSKQAGDLKDTTLNYYSMMYLNIIYTMDDCTVNSLSKVLGVNKSTVSKKIDYLEQNGYVVRERDEKDGRVFHIKLTDKVIEKEGRYDDAYIRSVKRIQAEFDESEIQAFCKALAIFSEEFGRVAP